MLQRGKRGSQSKIQSKGNVADMRSKMVIDRNGYPRGSLLTHSFLCASASPISLLFWSFHWSVEGDPSRLLFSSGKCGIHGFECMQGPLTGWDETVGSASSRQICRNTAYKVRRYQVVPAFLESRCPGALTLSQSSFHQHPKDQLRQQRYSTRHSSCV
jgi:hypothetical protein